MQDFYQQPRKTSILASILQLMQVGQLIATFRIFPILASAHFFAGDQLPDWPGSPIRTMSKYSTLLLIMPLQLQELINCLCTGRISTVCRMYLGLK